MKEASRADDGQRQTWRRRIERVHDPWPLTALPPGADSSRAHTTFSEISCRACNPASGPISRCGIVTISDLANEARAADAGRRAAIHGELDGLAAIMESHFRYEERAIGAALDGLDTGAAVGAGMRDTGWSRAVFDLEQ